MYVDYWIDAILYTIRSFASALWEFPFINNDDYFITFGEVFLYFGLAAIVLSFIFQIRVNTRWFKKD